MDPFFEFLDDEEKSLSDDFKKIYEKYKGCKRNHTYLSNRYKFLQHLRSNWYCHRKNDYLLETSSSRTKLWKEMQKLLQEMNFLQKKMESLLQDMNKFEEGDLYLAECSFRKKEHISEIPDFGSLFFPKPITLHD